MTFVKLPSLEKAEVLRIIEALEHHCACTRVAQPQDVPRCEELVEMLKRSAKLN